MDMAAIHTASLLFASGAALVVTLISLLRLFGPDRSAGGEAHVTSPVNVIRALWPFAAIATFEALQLRASGTLVAEWLFPGVAALAAELFAPSKWVVRWVRGTMITTAILLTLHGGFLLTKGYAAHPRVLSPGSKLEREWYTPLTGMMRVERPRR